MANMSIEPMGQPCSISCHCMEVVSNLNHSSDFIVNKSSYIVYVVLLCGYLALVYLFFPETKYVPQKIILAHRLIFHLGISRLKKFPLSLILEGWETVQKLSS